MTSLRVHRAHPASVRRWPLPLLAVAVLAAHLWLADQLPADRFGLGAADTMPQRMQVAFVRELAPAAPALPTRPALAPPVVSRPAAAARPAQAASAPGADAAAAGPADIASEPPASAPDAQAALPDPASPSTAVPEAPAPVAASETAAVSPAAPPSAAAAVSPAAPSDQSAGASQAVARPADSGGFEWPPSTRLSYRLTGNYRGPVEGQAQVDWLLQGTRYQVHMDLSIGPSFAPLASRRVSSEGRITAQGLAPQRYDEETRALFRQSRRLTVWLDEDRVRLANGGERARPGGVQDSASQFVHLTWLFTTQPELLRAGSSITLPLALPNHLEPWTYDVTGTEALQTPAGEVQTFHVKPRRAPRPGVDLTAELWVAPSLQYLPVRILIRQDAETFLDLLIERLPQQAQPSK